MAGNHAGQAGLGRRQLAEHALHRGDVADAVNLGDLGGDAQNHFELFPKAHVGLVVAQTVAGRLEIDIARERRVVVSEDALPRHLHIFKDDHGVGFVELP